MICGQIKKLAVRFCIPLIHQLDHGDVHEKGHVLFISALRLNDDVTTTTARGLGKIFFFMLFEKHLVCCCLFFSQYCIFVLCCTFGTRGDQRKKLFPFMHDELQMFSKGTMWPTWRFLHSFTVNSCCWDTFITWSGNKALPESNLSSEGQRVLTSFWISGKDPEHLH